MASMNNEAHLSIRIRDPEEELFMQLKEEGERLSWSYLQSPNSAKIQRVPVPLRDHKSFVRYFEPRAVAIGPIHHGKPKFQLAEKFKLVMAARFIEGSGRRAEDLHKIIEENIGELRDCYDEEVTMPYNDEVLTWMFFLDGCSTLQFIYSSVNFELALFKIKRDMVAFEEQDLFLLENQLPYRLLRLLMSLSDKEAELKIAIDDFVLETGTLMPAGRRRQHRHRPAGTAIILEEPTHLLGLLRITMLGTQEVPVPAIRKKFRRGRPQCFRNTRELRAAGIRIQRKSINLRNMSFTSLSFAGFLNLPPISVSAAMNVIAYEMCPDFLNDYVVTSYICFLDSLIYHPEDVRYLKSERILCNLRGTDEEVVQLFNEIGIHLVHNNDIYYDVRVNLEKHYKIKWKTWMAQFCHEHFSSPWTILTFIGVLTALGLSATQTYYTICSQQPSPSYAICHYLK